MGHRLKVNSVIATTRINNQLLDLIGEFVSFSAVFLDDEFFNLPSEFWLQAPILATTHLCVECKKSDYDTINATPNLEILLPWLYINNKISNTRLKQNEADASEFKLSEQRVLKLRISPYRWEPSAWWLTRAMNLIFQAISVNFIIIFCELNQFYYLKYVPSEVSQNKKTEYYNISKHGQRQKWDKWEWKWKWT